MMSKNKNDEPSAARAARANLDAARMAVFALDSILDVYHEQATSQGLSVDQVAVSLGVDRSIAASFLDGAQETSVLSLMNSRSFTVLQFLCSLVSDVSRTQTGVVLTCEAMDATQLGIHTDHSLDSEFLHKWDVCAEEIGIVIHWSHSV